MAYNLKLIIILWFNNMIQYKNVTKVDRVKLLKTYLFSDLK